MPRISSVVHCPPVHLSFADFIPRLRELAAESMEAQLLQCRRGFSAALADANCNPERALCKES